MKKFWLIFLTLVVVFFVFLSQLVRQTPDLIRQTLEHSFKKPMRISRIDYKFPSVLVLHEVEIFEEPGSQFSGEHVFYAPRVTAEISWETLAGKRLSFHDIRFSRAEIIVRKYQDVFTYPFGGWIPTADKAVVTKNWVFKWFEKIIYQLNTSPVEIAEVIGRDCRFIYQDYDVQEKGYTLDFQATHFRIKNLNLDTSHHKTTFEFSGQIVQGKNERVSKVAMEGWYQPKDDIAQILIEAFDLHLPYLGPFYKEIIPMNIEEGILNFKSSIAIERHAVETVNRLEISHLLLSSLATGQRFLGLDESDLLSYLKDSSGKLKLRVPVRFERKSASRRDIEALFRQSLERSMKFIVLSQASKILGSATANVEVPDYTPKKKETIEEKVAKLKDWFKY